MFPSMPFNQSSVAISGYSSRYESQSYTKYDQNPVSTHSNRPAESEEAAEVTGSRADQFDVSGLVDQIWSFASHRINEAKAEGASDEELESLWQAAKEGVTAGFGEAKDILEDLGELDEPLAMKIDSAYGQLMDKIDNRGETSDEMPERSDDPAIADPKTDVSARNRVDRAISLYQYERQTFSLDLKTTEGDTIQIRAVNEKAANAEDFRFGNLSSTRWSSAEQSGYSLVIKGDLNEQELADLDALLADVNALAEEFYDGQLDKAFDMASELNINGTSLMSLDLSLNETESKRASVYTQTAGGRDSLPAGLAPLQEYANKLIDAQNKWFERFDSADNLLETIANHPRDNGPLARLAQELLV